MPKLLRSSETAGCGATIELDNGEVVYVSIAQTGVLVRRWDMNGGSIKSLLSNFFGPKLYNESSVYKNAQTARALSLIYPEQASPLSFKNPVLAAFSNAIWHCASAAEVCTVLNEAVAKCPDAERAVGIVPASRDSAPLHKPAGIPGDALKMADALMRLFKSGAAFELVDEEGARWVDELLRDAADPVAPPELKAEALAVRRYVGTVDGLPLTRAQTRTFTARFETYLIENTAPNAQLADTLGRLRSWLARVYMNLEKARAPISDDIRDWYARIISVDRGAPVLVPDRTRADDAV